MRPRARLSLFAALGLVGAVLLPPCLEALDPSPVHAPLESDRAEAVASTRSLIPSEPPREATTSADLALLEDEQEG